ncbi:MAG: ferritin, partial [Bacteroidales bacterium]|nr:ferritin [Bacteroidales bacterium]
SALIRNLMSIAKEDHDYAAESKLNWFIEEQVEEEEAARDIIFAVESVGNSKNDMYILDKELAARVYNVPAPLAGK